MALMVFSIVPLGLADENESVVDEDTENEILLMNTGLGSEIRLLQLEQSVERQIDHAELIVEFAQENDINTTELEAIIAELKLVLEEIQAVDSDADNAVEMYVDLKKDAIELSQEFRTLAADLFEDLDLTQLREQLREQRQIETQLGETIRNKIRELNAERFNRYAGYMGMNGQALGLQIMAGNVTQDQIRERVQEHLHNMTGIGKQQAFKYMQEERVRNQVFKNNAIDEAQQGFEMRKENRLEYRYINAENMTGDHFERMRERMNQRMQIMNPDHEPLMDGTGPRSESIRNKMMR